MCVPGGIATPTPSPPPTPVLGACVGDCNSDGVVDISELITGVNVALGTEPVDACRPIICCESCPTSAYVGCVVLAVNNALDGCPQTYRLTEGSTISFSPMVGNLPDVGPEPLSGTFTVVRAPFRGPPPIEGNVIFAFVITDVAFQSSHFTVTSNMGSLSGVLDIVYMQTSVTINDGMVSLMGGGPLSVTPGEILSGVKISGGGYALTLFASR